MFPKIVQVVPTKNHTVYVYFEDGEIVCYDVGPMLDRPVFSALKNEEIFVNSCTILNDTLAWDINGNRNPAECIDIDPDTLYELDAAAECIA
ncbi:MAG: DUF2442 domain-containing protein [Parasporobacterium sp.]|nr:DUF2442 domain-containing protein [Parasporobacterium sp.]